MRATAEDEELEAIKRRLLKKYMEEGRRMEQAGKPIDKPLEVTDANFEDFIRKAGLVVVDCWAEWCMPCRLMAPAIDELARRFSGRVLFGKLNVDHNPATAARFSIEAIPTLLIFKEGRLVDSLVGLRPLHELEEIIKAYL